METTHTVRITASAIEVDGNALPLAGKGEELLREAYRTRIGDYPRFYKMDILCKLGFVATELLLAAEGKERFVERDDRAVVFFGESASIVSDKEYQQTISAECGFFPSPSTFVHTLPNIVVGEVALRNHYHGETAYMVCEPTYDMRQHTETTLSMSPSLGSAIFGWVDARSKDHFEAELWIAEK